jgi:signal transduction histidine kinase
MVAGSILLVGSGVLGISIFSYTLIKNARQDELESKADILLRSFADHYAEAIKRKDEAKLIKGFQDLTNDPAVIYGMSLDMDGKVISHTSINQVGHFELETLRQVRESPTSIVMENRPDQLLDAAMVVRAGKKDVGIARIGLSRKPAEDFVRNVVGRMATVTAAALALTLLCSLTFAWMISQPIGALLQGIEEIGKGNLLYAVGIRSRDEIGQVARAFNDMTEDLRVAHAQLVDANIQLAGRLKDLAISNKELKAAQEKVVRSEKLAAIGKLASGIGHELRNPLGAIRNAFYYIKECLSDTALAKEDPNLMEFIAFGEKEIRSATDIIGDLLEFSRVVKLTRHSTDVNALLLDARKSLEVPANVELIEDYQKDMPPAIIDPQKIRQVVINMTLNAIQAMPKGGQLRIATRLEGERGNPSSRISILFKDTGVGIPKDIQDQIFEPLFTTKAKGTGLGLSICQGFLQAHGGAISVDSEPGRGAAFVIAFPLGEAPHAA